MGNADPSTRMRDNWRILAQDDSKRNPIFLHGLKPTIHKAASARPRPCPDTNLSMYLELMWIESIDPSTRAQDDKYWKGQNAKPKLRPSPARALVVLGV